MFSPLSLRDIRITRGTERSPTSPLDFWYGGDTLIRGSRWDRDEGRRKVLARIFSHVRSISVAIAALEPPRELRGWYPRSCILHSVHSPCVQCTLQTISRWLLDVCRHRRRRRLREKNPAYAYTVDGDSYVPCRCASGASGDREKVEAVNNGL